MADKLACRVFVESDLPLADLASRLAGWLSGSASGPTFAKTIHTQAGEIEARANMDADRARAGEFPDGFLYFAYVLEVDAPDATLREQAALVGRILESCWAESIPAVAACDYEDALPRGGGYHDRTIPWPARTGGVAGAVSGHLDGPLDEHI